MSDDALAKGFVAAQIGEALANYALVDRPLEDRVNLAHQRSPSPEKHRDLVDDQMFWARLFDDHAGDFRPPIWETRSVHVHFAVVSEWIARVPGLYWRPGSAKMRGVKPADIESETRRWTTYRPPGKSQQVSGGVGTLRLPPTEDGYRLVTLTTSYNASSGVPALVAPEVWEHHRLSEGSMVTHGMALWQEMPQKWAAEFPIVRGIPRGCLFLDDVTKISVDENKAPVLVHPFSVMEYWDGPTQLHDFVYATADTSEVGFRRELTDFFEEYRTANNRDGSYLLAADISHPMWDATFASPGEMRAEKMAQLRLIERRVQDAANGQDIAEALVRKLSDLPDEAALKRLSTDAGIEWRRWSRRGLLTEDAARLVDEAIRSGKQQALLQVLLEETS